MRIVFSKDAEGEILSLKLRLGGTLIL